jgi:hypothetical protein
MRGWFQAQEGARAIRMTELLIDECLSPDLALMARERGMISVFVHEFGHCLGLPDDTTDPTSLMNPNYVAADIEQVFFPSLSDFQRLRSSLEAYISGSSVGFSDVKNCAGLRRLRNSRAGV